MFEKNGLEVDIASPTGGQPVADNYDVKKEYNHAFINDVRAMKKLQNSLKLSAVNASDYQGIFVVGGKGPMFDLYQDESLQRLIRDIWESNGIVSAVCHGPAALVDVKLSDGRYLVAGKKVNGFTNEEEAAFGKKWRSQFAFLLEDKLKARGANFEHSPMMLNHVAVDGRLITGQNPFSTVDTAISTLKAMGTEPTFIPAYQDDKTIRLVRRLINGESYTTEQLAAEQVQAELIGSYGYYVARFAKTDQDRKKAIKLMELVSPLVRQPMLELSIAENHQALGNYQQAKTTLIALLEDHPDLEQAQQMLDGLNK